MFPETSLAYKLYNIFCVVLSLTWNLKSKNSTSKFNPILENFSGKFHIFRKFQFNFLSCIILTIIQGNLFFLHRFIIISLEFSEYLGNYSIVQNLKSKCVEKKKLVYFSLSVKQSCWFDWWKASGFKSSKSLWSE